MGDGGHGRGNLGKGSALDQEVATTMIYVALEQVEAMTLADSMVDINLRRAVPLGATHVGALQGTPL